jgi:hypothetical protein
MPNHARDIRSGVWGIERQAEAQAAAAQRGAQAQEATARAAQSAAKAATFGVGFQVGAQIVNTAFAAKAARQQQAEAQAFRQAMAQQQAMSDFVMWRDSTVAGQAFADWQVQANRFLQFLNGRDFAWREAWARFIERAASEVPADQRDRYAKTSYRLSKRYLRVPITS